MHHLRVVTQQYLRELVYRSAQVLAYNLIQPRQLAKANYVRFVQRYTSKTPLISTQRSGGNERISPIVFGPGHVVPVAKSI